MMRMKLCNWMLMGAMVWGLGMGMVACSDDDDNADESKQSGGTVMSTDISDDENVLAGLLSAWCDFDMSTDLKGGIINQSFEAIEGVVVDPAAPFVRTVVVGTVDRADSLASAVLSPLGCSSTSPDGFTWSNASIGNIKYRHSTGNELGVIDVDVKQIPSLTKLRLVATPEVNANDEPYYSKGDIIQNTSDGKYYICVSQHSYGQKATWLSFDSQNAAEKKQTTNTAHWIGTGYDRYYSKLQANYSTLATWLTNWILDDQGYWDIVNAFSAVGLTDAAVVNQIVPSTQHLRTKLIQGITKDSRDVLLEAWKTVRAGENQPRLTSQVYNSVYEEKAGKWQTRIYEPTGLLLGYQMRWTLGGNYWVPYVVLVQDADWTAFTQAVNGVESQTTLNSGHFKWQELLDHTIFVNSISAENANIINGRYHICTVALHWTHDKFNIANDKIDYYGLLDFTKQLSGAEANDWMRTNITSVELLQKDNGRKYSKFKTVRCLNHITDRDF